MVFAYLAHDANEIFLAATPRQQRAAATSLARDAHRLALLPGLAAIAPNAPVVGQLIGFASGGLADLKPAPVSAP
jgi:hypothetical protein